MATQETVDLWRKVDDGVVDMMFPKYFVSQPPHRDTLEPIYYKMVEPNGPIFWRAEGQEHGKEATAFDLLME